MFSSVERLDDLRLSGEASQAPFGGGLGTSLARSEPYADRHRFNGRVVENRFPNIRGRDRLGSTSDS